MEYSINKLSKLSGISTRTLRYYDEINLLKPARVNPSKYRIYTGKELDTLQQILFYKELGFSLEDIKGIILVPGFDREKAFEGHLVALQKRREQLDILISNVTKSIAVMKGEGVMTDKEKFEGFKKSLIDENEEKYGEEIRAKYGDKVVDDSNARLQGLTEEQYEKGQELYQQFEETLKEAFEVGDPAGELAGKACDLHKQWLGVYSPTYSKEYHIGLGEMYVADERFKANYEKFGIGCTEFLRDAIRIYCG
jgi:DNA-binding transcriptional MerR regulator